jgi:hypothetical protein
MLDPRRRLFAHRLFRGACLRVPVPGGALLVKDVARLGRDLARTVLVDNTPAVRSRSRRWLVLTRKTGGRLRLGSASVSCRSYRQWSL